MAERRNRYNKVGMTEEKQQKAGQTFHINGANYVLVQQRTDQSVRLSVANG